MQGCRNDGLSRGFGFCRVTAHGGVCNPAANVLCDVTASDRVQNVTDGITNPVRIWYGEKA